MRGRPRRRRRNACLQALEAMRTAAPSLGLTDALVFLYVCENEGLNLRELAQVAGVSDSTASRTARSLARAEDPFSLPPASGLIEVRRNPSDARGRVLHLTAEGAALRLQIDAAIESGVRIVERPAEPAA